MSFSILRILLAALFVMSALCKGAIADEASSDVMLTVAVRGSSQEFKFTRADLERMPQVTYQTSTIWTEGVLDFRGVPLSLVLKAAGVTGGVLLLNAVNDYEAELPVAGVNDEVPILAMTIDGNPMSLRDKGPLWLIYPYDASTVYQSEVVYTRSVWQLQRIEVVP